MTTALEGGEWSAARPGGTLPPGNTRYPLYRRLGGPQGRSGQVCKISSPPGFDPWTVHPLASHNTDYATRPKNITIKCKYFLFQILGMTTYFEFVYSVLLLKQRLNPLNADLNPICHLLALLGAHHILHISRIRVKALNEDLMAVFDIENENILDDRQLLEVRSRLVSRPVLGQTACEESSHQSSSFEHLHHSNPEYKNELPGKEGRKRSVKIAVLRRAHSVLNWLIRCFTFHFLWVSLKCLWQSFYVCMLSSLMRMGCLIASCAVHRNGMCLVWSSHGLQ